MNTEDWKNVLRTVAPGIAALLGGPLAGTAVGALSEALLGKKGGTEAELAPLIAAGSPDILAKLKQIDAELTSKLADAGIQVQELENADRASARQREATSGDKTTRNLAYAYTVGYFAIVWCCWKFGIPKEAHDLLTMLLGVLTAAQAAIMNYYFGSSAGSEQSKALVHKALDRA